MDVYRVLEFSASGTSHASSRLIFVTIIYGLIGVCLILFSSIKRLGVYVIFPRTQLISIRAVFQTPISLIQELFPPTTIPFSVDFI